MIDVINEHLRTKVVEKNEEVLKKSGITLPDRGIYLEEINPEFRFSTKQRHYLGDISLQLETVIKKAKILHNNMISDGYSTVGLCSWEIDHTVEYYHLLDSFSKLLPKLDKLARKKVRNTNVNQAICDFYMTITYPLINAINDNTDTCQRNMFRDAYIKFVLSSLDENKKGKREAIEVYDIIDVFDIQQVINGSCKVFDYLSEKPSFLDDNERINMIDDIFVMREYLFKGWNYNKHRIDLDGFVMEIDLATSIPQLSIYPEYLNLTEYSCFDYIKIEPCTHTMSFGFNQFLFSNIQADFLLKKCHDYLLSIFMSFNIDFSQDKNDIAYKNVEPDYLFCISEELSELDVNNEDIKKNLRLLSKIKYSNFKKYMQNNYNCNFSNGKGSEIKIQLKNSPIYTIGHHKKDFMLSPLKVKFILKRLGISLNDFLEHSTLT
ncbi:hypothetical protein ERW49_18380 [Aliivibrio finisterrensis]|uniref:Uncharacterized protein n=1 Tax=Aliivibrio finisterrensis TaxID=511998 RepID=A0A4Q5K8G0_9GAMM|nr:MULTISPECIES: hypothetical protein [Aliivibrio]MDD9174003.1 hypothetical protein [Aliivibrio sp. S3TY1]MDD9191080.1 hypothetical protein [Aliivibrio sp. S2TY2]RYU42136.1 hypothetical protein ERW49_18380 [Aliivibrio finisterrensis]